MELAITLLAEVEVAPFATRRFPKYVYGCLILSFILCVLIPKREWWLTRFSNPCLGERAWICARWARWLIQLGGLGAVVWMCVASYQGDSSDV